MSKVQNYLGTEILSRRPNIKPLGKSQLVKSLPETEATSNMSDASPTAASADTISPRGGLLTPSFIGLLVTQFLVALNDNMLRWLIVPIGQKLMPEDEQWVISVGLACFVLPYILLAAPAGYLADRFSKRTIIVACKAAEIFLMIMAVGAILTGNVYPMFVVIFLMGAQSALFSPSKLGSIPEIVREDCLAAANGLFGMTTVVAIVLGSIAGYSLSGATTLTNDAPGQYRWWIHTLALVGVAIVGFGASLLIHPLRAANPTRKFPYNAISRTYRDLSTLASNRPIQLIAIGSAMFWWLGALAQMNIDYFAKNELSLADNPTYVGLLLAFLAIGVGAGSVLAGAWSKGRIELGMVPFGAACMSFSAVCLAILYYVIPGAETGGPWSFVYCCTAVGLVALGIGGGLFDIPLLASLQQRSPDASRGSVMAAYNFWVFAGMLGTSALFWILGSALQLPARAIFLLMGLALIPITIGVVKQLPRATVRFTFWFISRVMYRVRIVGVENVPEEGPVLLAPNHISYADGPLLGLSFPRHVRFVVFADYFEGWWINWFAHKKVADVIKIKPGKRSVVESIRKAREALKNGEVVGIFPEGGIARDGEMQPFRPGFLSALKHTDAPVIPVYLEGLWGSIFSFKGGKAFWKWPRHWFRPVTLRFGKPIAHPKDADEVRDAVIALGKEDLMHRQKEEILPRKFLRTCRHCMRRTKIVDSSGAKLSGGSLLTRTLVLRRLLRREVLADDERNVGLLLPPSVATVVTNAALSVDCRVAVNLNYTFSSDVINHCAKEAGLRHILTSRRVMEKFPDIKLDTDVVYLEDLKEKVTLADKLTSAAAAWLMPVSLLEQRLGLSRIELDDLLTIIFTSGTTGMPKGAMLTHRNVASNVDAFNSVVALNPEDTLIGLLPFFHSFGYTANLWLALTLAPKVAFHYSPREPRAIGKLCRTHGGNILISTPTFLNWYIRGCSEEDFASLDVAITGAERLPADVIDRFEKKFGFRPVQGYGTTELSPVVSLNVPEHRRGVVPKGSREGTIGQPIPGVQAKIVDPDSNEPLGTNTPGMLLISGPNVMKGYLKKPAETAEVVRDGWYTTGDIAMIDDDEFITITDRLSRFSKIGGEMVSHGYVEESLMKAIDEAPQSEEGGNNDDQDAQLVVTAVADPKKGERLVVLHTGLEQSPDEICRRMADADIAGICIPSPKSFLRIDEIPLLGSGKLNLRRVKEIAQKGSGEDGSGDP